MATAPHMPPGMTREQFIAKYGPVFVADNMGGNAASEVAGQNTGDYYDRYLGPNGINVNQVNLQGDIVDQPIDWGGGRYADSLPGFDAYDNVNPHPESNRGNGLDEAWKAVGRPIATGLAAYYGAGALNGLMGGAATGALGGGELASTGSAMGAGSGSIGAGGSMGSIGGSAAGGGMTLAEQMAAYGAGGGGVTGGLSTGTVGGFTGAAGGDLLGSAAGGGLFGDVGAFLKDNPMLTKLGGAALGALSAKDQTNTTTQARDPWGPAQQYLKDNLATNANMQKYYQANPFSAEQKTAYQGLLNTLANNQANGNVLLGNASNFLRSSRGALPQMSGLLTGTQAQPIDWAKYSNLGLLGG